MRKQNDFTKPTVTTLGKRAGYICSNPDCKALTSGPHADATKAVNVGEAAHIKGAEPSSARYDARMIPKERASITNGIWLCSRCHTLIDKDERRYTVDVLYYWKRQHEDELIKNVSGGWERKVRERILRPFENESPAAYQIALDQPKYWEFLLTIELMRTKFAPMQREYNDLSRGLLYRPSKVLHDNEVHSWMRQKINDFTALTQLIRVAVDEELGTAWGPPGEPGDPLAILRTTDKLALAYKGLLKLETDIHFTLFSEHLETVKIKLQGCTIGYTAQLDQLLAWIAEIFEHPNPTGRVYIDLTLVAPPELANATSELLRLLTVNRT